MRRTYGNPLMMYCPGWQILYRVSTDYLLGRQDVRMLDISGLTTAEAAAISNLVASMTAKNQKLEDMQT